MHCSPHQVVAVEAARQEFQSQGHELIPVEFFYGSTEYTWTLSDKYRPEHWLCLFPEQKSVSNSTLFWELRRKIKELRIDVVVINGWYGFYAWWLVLLKRWIGCKVVVVSDTVSWKAPRKWYKEFPKRMLLRGVDAGFVAGTPQAEYLRSLGMPDTRLTFGNDVVDNQLYSSLPGRTKPEGRKIVIGTAARLIPEKNLLAAIQAFDTARRKYPELVLEWRIAGQGPLEEELKQSVRELQVPVVFLGFVGYTDMPGFYGQLDLYWQPSASESWGLVVNEAMAAGLPTLVSDRCGCAHDLVTVSTGWIHQVSHSGMVDGLEKALMERDSWPERGKAARDMIKRWDVSRFSEGLVQACQIAVSENR
ncbi:MAG TPA: glycosyltransferase family 4 protein [Gemmatales bacterium]|nr:glycosyltransferase family 4 protein [Gemmatales bacterium]